MYGWHGWEWTLGGGFMGIGMLLMWAVPITLIVALVLYVNNQSRTTRQPETATELLEKAYARGEINREEFLQKREDLLGAKNTLPQK